MNPATPVPLGLISSATVPVGSYLYAPISTIQATITAIPGSGGTVTVQFSTTPGAAVLGASANWQNWPSGTVSAITTDGLTSAVTAIRAIATTVAGTLEVVQ